VREKSQGIVHGRKYEGNVWNELSGGVYGGFQGPDFQKILGLRKNPKFNVSFS